MTLRAPFTGTITTVDANVGQAVSPGQPLLTLADLSRLQVETTDLSERDVAQVEPGQVVSVFVGPLGVEVPGRVVQIAPQASVIGGDVVYTVVVALTEQPENLRCGMSVEVTVVGRR
jgi:multidrug resistance efflux pump